jgi:hypothetical protein
MDMSTEAIEKRAMEYSVNAGAADARKVFEESPAEARDLLARWEALLPTMSKGMDKWTIEGAVAEWRKLLGK